MKLMSFRYGQRHSVELDSATRVAAKLGAADHIIADIEVPKGRAAAEMNAGIPIT